MKNISRATALILVPLVLSGCVATNTQYWERHDGGYTVQANLTTAASEEHLFALLEERAVSLCGEVTPVILGSEDPISVEQPGTGELRASFNSITRVVYCGQEAADAAAPIYPLTTIEEERAMIAEAENCPENIIEPEMVRLNSDNATEIFENGVCRVFIGYSVDASGDITLIDRPTSSRSCDALAETVESALLLSSPQDIGPLEYCVEAVEFNAGF